MDTQQPTKHSLQYRKIAAEAWVEVIQPYLIQYRPELVKSCLYAIGSSVAYGLADEYSDIDTVLVLPQDEFNERNEEWVNWSYQNPEILAFIEHHGVDLNVKVTTWEQMGASILFNKGSDWQKYYEGHHHYVSTLLPIHDPQGYVEEIHKAIATIPAGLAEVAAVRLEGELMSLDEEACNLAEVPHFAGLLAYPIVSRILPLLFHRASAPLPFHKWQWPLGERLGTKATSVFIYLRRLLDHQQFNCEPLPEGLIPHETRAIPWRISPLQLNTSHSTLSTLPDELRIKALSSVQWHLEERGCYQMLRALVRGWRYEAQYYLCATRCLLIKGAVLLETGQLPLGKNLQVAWEETRTAFPGLEGYLWPEPGNDSIAKTLEAIGLFRAHLQSRSALPELYLERPLWSPPSYELACILEEP